VHTDVMIGGRGSRAPAAHATDATSRFSRETAAGSCRGRFPGEIVVITTSLAAQSTLPVPFCYRNGMSKQIAVRLPEELVDFVDEQVGSGAGRSRAAVVARALERDRRRAVAARDAAILGASPPDSDLAGLAEHVADLKRKLD
jgi:Arc/MetJ-type ribon-helix-helix transcriptional regulator